MLKERVIEFYNKDTYDLNCAETIIYAANVEYNLKLTKETLKSVAAFGGGMAIESVCGAIAGSLAVIGILFTNVRAHESNIIKDITSAFMNEFNERLKSINCKELKESYRNDVQRCSIIVEEAADILDKIVRTNCLFIIK